MITSPHEPYFVPDPGVLLSWIIWAAIFLILYNRLTSQRVWLVGLLWVLPTSRLNACNVLERVRSKQLIIDGKSILEVKYRLEGLKDVISSYMNYRRKSSLEVLALKGVPASPSQNRWALHQSEFGCHTLAFCDKHGAVLSVGLHSSTHHSCSGTMFLHASTYSCC